MAKRDRLKVVEGLLEQEDFSPALLFNSTDDEGYRIITIVCRDHGVRIDKVLGTSRLQRLVIPRHWCMFLLRRFTDMTFENINTYFSSANHTSIIYAVNKIQDRIDIYPDYKKTYEHYQNLLG